MRSVWNRLFGNARSAPPAPPANDDDTVLSHLREQIRWDVAAGFYDPPQIFENAVDAFEDEMERSLLQDHARLCLGEELAAHAAAQCTWPAPTDCDRLDSAFAAL